MVRPLAGGGAGQLSFSSIHFFRVGGERPRKAKAGSLGF
jgi:hypothetical protein